MLTLTQIIRRTLNRYKTRVLYPSRVKGKPKIFCIGMNKTGTTSFRRAFKDLGFIVGNIQRGGLLLPNYERGDFDSIIGFCKSAQVFKDFPFSYPETYKYLDKAFPDAKFVLTVRDSPEQWYNSSVSFRNKRYGGSEDPYTEEDMKNHDFVKKGWAWELYQLSRKVFDADKSEKEGLTEKEIYIKSYLKYNEEVEEYFKGRPDKLLVINVAEKESYQKLMEFLDINSPYSMFPWVLKTEKIPID